MLFEWMRAYGFKQLDDSDSCVFTLTAPDQHDSAATHKGKTAGAA